ncbi:MAG: ATP-binding cassette domain-containing protein [Anaerolineae bacterium CFX3]|jgi:ABC-2 type transport system ATP-binding protein|nr:ATP-binding cassette domain-containing protein [Anaerolineae bacterium]MBV6467635.1 Doxorubicin resistance ATP-binding protein DrrA [Anaerolineales bacterium]MCE7905260.1 ATP-binding cassette domain-containing protein [Anaerolineae bacterium CFX3]MDL1926906.1 ATP-binding cassette domain-containing protein [Anaerolineae bacterium AMX1]GER80965.1 export ABC transporter ATP-binding protein [Candidatus Denitrolinea symbiosum]
MPPILEVKDLHKNYGDFAAVKGVTFDIQEGEIFSLLGPNGAGKTTTISMLSTLYAPTAGDAVIAGHSVTRDPMAVRNAIGVVPQDIALYEDLTAHENLVFWGQMYGLGGKTLRARVDEVLEQIGLADKAKNRVKTYSGGMKRRVNIGVGLLHKPRLLFMDEPTVGIDPQSRRAILDTVKDLNQKGMTVLYTTHYMEEAQELSDRVGIIDHGELIALGTQKELTRQVGETETLILHLGENDDPEALVKSLEGVKEIIKAQSTDHEVSVIAREAEEALAPVVAKANERGVKIHSIDIREPNLEAVFLHLTGRALRD